MQKFNEDGEPDERVNEDLHRVLVDKMPEGATLHQRRIAQPLGDEEIENDGDGSTTVEGDGPAQVLLVLESEDEARNPHHHQTNDKGDGHRKEDTYDDGEGLVGVDEVGVALSCLEDVHQRQGRRAAQQTKHHRHGGRCGHTQSVEDVEQDDIGGAHG